MEKEHFKDQSLSSQHGIMSVLMNFNNFMMNYWIFMLHWSACNRLETWKVHEERASACLQTRRKEDQDKIQPIT